MSNSIQVQHLLRESDFSGFPEDYEKKQSIYFHQNDAASQIIICVHVVLLKDGGYRLHIGPGNDWKLSWLLTLDKNLQAVQDSHADELKEAKGETEDEVDGVPY